MNFLDIINWNWCTQEGVQGVLKLVSAIISVIRLAVPIVLIVMTSLDIAKKVINPEVKEGQKKIMNRVIAAVVFFFIPVLVRFVFIVVDWGFGSSGTAGDAESNLKACINRF